MNLPVQTILPDLQRHLAAGHDCVLTAPPGSGKTTCVPIALYKEPWLKGKKIVMLEPRRIATRAAAWRMADLLGEEVGGTVGYNVRLERKESVRTRILVVTEGLLTRKLQGDPELSDVGLVIFDEFHERSLHADLAMALTRDVQRGLRPDLRILVMSATLYELGVRSEKLEVRNAQCTMQNAQLATSNFSLLTPNCIYLHAEGRLFPVETRWGSAPRSPFGFALYEAMGKACVRALTEHDGSVLAFLPGEGEIHGTVDWLHEYGHCSKNVDILPLYGAMPKNEQDAVLRKSPQGRRKVVLATSIAESSLTIDGITAVVDSGLVRVSRFSPSTGMERLETLRITQDRADQRQGRAGRLMPGVCYRLWDEITHRQLPPAALPEILTADLASLRLTVADWGINKIDDLPWVTPPPMAMWEQSTELLKELGAMKEGVTGIPACGTDRNVCDTLHITPLGKQMAKMPLHPRLARMLGTNVGTVDERCLLAAVLSERVMTDDRFADIEVLMEVVRRGHAHSKVRELAKEFRRIISTFDVRCSMFDVSVQQEKRQTSNIERPTSNTVGILLSLAYPDRVARRRGGRGELRYLMRCGRGGTLRKDDPLANHEWIVIAELDDSSADASIRHAAIMDEADILDLFASQIETRHLLSWDRQRKAVNATEAVCLGAIILKERPLEHLTAEERMKCLCEGIRLEGLERLNWTPEAQQLRGRLWWAAKSSGGVPASVGGKDATATFDDETLAEKLEEWLGPFLLGKKSLDDAAKIDLCEALERWVGYARMRELDKLCPTHVAVPSGSHIRIDYTNTENPVLAVRIQEVFGMAESPKVCGGRVPVLMHLLSPARRPVQITKDLASFWRTGYAEARKDLRGRYPKHYWPDDPLQAEAIRGVRRK